MKCYIGIDPGRDGAIVALNQSGIIVHKGVMPFDEHLNNFDFLSLCKLIKGIKDDHDSVFVITEKLSPIFGASAHNTFKLGMAYQCAIDAVKALKLGYMDIKPTVWTKLMWKGLHEIRKPETTRKNKDGTTSKVKGRMDSKAMSLQAVKKYFPSEDLKKSSRCKNFHDGIVDALLLAEYGRRNNL